MHVLLLTLLTLGQECQQATTEGRAAYERRAYDEAAHAFARAMVACDATDGLVLAHAQALLLSRQVGPAIEALSALLAREPTHVDALKLRARASYLRGLDRDAEADLQAAARLAPHDSEVPYDLGRIQYQQGRHRDAYAAFARALTLDPRAYRALDNMGLAAEALGEFDEALRHYLAAIAIVRTGNPSYGSVYANLADLLLKRGEYRQAFDAAAEAAQRDPNDARHFYLTGKALVLLRRDATSLAWLERATTLDAGYAEPHYLLAQVYRRLGRADDAARAMATFEQLAERPRERR